MIPKYIKDTISNPGLPGFERFWGYQNSRLGSEARLTRSLRLAGQNLSYRKVYRLGPSHPVPEERSPAPGRSESLETFLQESSSKHRSEQPLKEQNARCEEGNSMPAIQ